MNTNLPAPRKPARKRTAVLLLACLTALALVVPAMAHGHGGGHHGGRGWYAQQPQPAQITVCAVEGCEAAGRHTHNGVTYCGYSHTNGVCDGKCLALCSVEGCEVAGRHIHDGVAYCGSNHAGGFCNGQCLTLCPVEGCTTAGQHVHDGVAYCGNHHEAGYCGGGCAVAGSGTGYRHGCHG